MLAIRTQCAANEKQWGVWNNSWFCTATVPSSSRIRAGGEPQGGNFLFEDGRVAWHVAEVIELGATVGGWDFYCKTPL